jgi:hypothetical protein
LLSVNAVSTARCRAVVARVTAVTITRVDAFVFRQLPEITVVLNLSLSRKYIKNIANVWSMAGASIEFWFDESAQETRFIREYLADAWDRFETWECWTTGWYWSYKQFGEYDVGVDGGYIEVVFEGDPEQVVAKESDRWDDFDGLESWELRTYDEEGYDSLLEQQKDAKGDVGGEWDYRLKPLVTRFSLTFLREFEGGLPAVGDETDANPAGFGFWAVIHYTMIQCGYEWYDEIAACQKATQNRLKSIAGYRGGEAARSEYERIRTEWDDYGDELEEWLAENPTGEASID